MTQTRAALLIGVIPIVVGIVYYALQAALGTEADVDPAGALLLVCLGLSMGFGFAVILRGARDL